MNHSNLSNTIHERIKSAHRRSLDFGVSRKQVVPLLALRGVELQRKLEVMQRFLNLAFPFVDLLSEFVAGNDYIILLTDNQGCLLRITGNTTLVEKVNQKGIVPGAFMNEQSIGANAISIALFDEMPVQVTGADHFAELFHGWSCSAAPIRDEKGVLIGCINISGHTNKVFPHLLGLAVASGKAIEYQLQSSFSEMRQKEAYRFVSQILNTLEFGVIATDVSGRIRRANNLTSGLLRAPIDRIENHFINEFIPTWEKYFSMIKKNEIVLDEEVQIIRAAGTDNFNMNVYPLTDGDGTISGSVLTLRDIKRVYKIVNKYTGMQARYHFDDLIGESDEMKRIIEFCKNIADSPSTVLIQGESGTGKEVLAQSIHNYSSRKKGDFVALNCGAIPDSLIESELFGYTEGAFTSAKKGGKPGKFELADGGTLFLDEIGEMATDMQVKLLRALQERSITRVGGDKLISVDVRIIAATNRNLLEMVKEGKFRQDLYYRLSVIPVYIPPLRHRREDIPMLINFFLNLKSVKLRKQLPDMDNRFFKKLVGYDWPGNVRELENFIEKYVNLDGNLSWSDDLLQFTGAPMRLSNQEILTGFEKVVSEKSNQSKTITEEIKSLAELERDAIERAISHFNGNMTRVANALGISRNALYQKVKRNSGA